MNMKNKLIKKMDIISQILVDRIIKRETKFDFYRLKYNLNKEDYNSKFKSLKSINANFSNQIIIKALKLFDSKIQSDIDVFKWNQKNKFSKKKKKEFSFIKYSKIDNNGKSIKTEELFSVFFSDISDLYDKQNKINLSNELPWIKDTNIINDEDHVCYYCGINESILNTLYIDENYTCKTKRNRGAWFELDRKDSSFLGNVYSKDNMVLCCYFCNNHKSDVISPEDMRFFFGKPIFQFLMNKFEYLTKNK